MLWDLFSNPRMIHIKLAAPPPVCTINATLSLFPHVTVASAEACRLEFLGNHKFFYELNKNLLEKRHHLTICGGWYEFLYMAVRFSNPRIVFETGVFDGQSGAVILQALNDNSNGILVSVDLPAVETVEWSTSGMPDTTLPPHCQPGWVIPDYLRKRHHLVLGNSKELLPKLFKEWPEIDIFLHDSLHTFEHQYFEYSTAWSHLTDGGFLLSDDIHWSQAFALFCREKDRTYLRLGNGGFGAVRK